MKKRFFYIVLAAVLFGCGSGDKSHLTINSPTPIRTKFSASDKTLSLESKRPFVLFFLSADCGACKAAVPHMNDLFEKYQDKVEIIGVLNGGKNAADDIEFVKSYNILFKVISDVKSVQYLSNAVGGVYGVPVFYMYDENGKLSAKYLGLTPKSKLEESLKRLI